MAALLCTTALLAMHGGSRVGVRGRSHIYSSAVSGPATTEVRAHPSSGRAQRGRCAVARAPLLTPRLPVRARQAKAKSFVQTEMRKAAMALHTFEQAPKEGKREAPKPAMEWAPTKKGYLQFLVDSRYVYGSIEEIVDERAELAVLKNTGLERTAALDQDIAWFLSEGLEATTPSEAATGYVAELKSLSTPAFVCHFYNYYFAHTAGGRMIGKKLSDMLLDGRVLEFYQVRRRARLARRHAPVCFSRAGTRAPRRCPRRLHAQWDGDVKELLDGAKQHIDVMAAAWTQDERDACLAQTPASFKGGGGLMASLRT